MKKSCINNSAFLTANSCARWHKIREVQHLNGSTQRSKCFLHTRSKWIFFTKTCHILTYFMMYIICSFDCKIMFNFQTYRHVWQYDTGSHHKTLFSQKHTHKKICHHSHLATHSIYNLWNILMYKMRHAISYVLGKQWFFVRNIVCLFTQPPSSVRLGQQVRYTY